MQTFFPIHSISATLIVVNFSTKNTLPLHFTIRRWKIGWFCCLRWWALAMLTIITWKTIQFSIAKIHASTQNPNKRCFGSQHTNVYCQHNSLAVMCGKAVDFSDLYQTKYTVVRYISNSVPIMNGELLIARVDVVDTIVLVFINPNALPKFRMYVAT